MPRKINTKKRYYDLSTKWMLGNNTRQWIGLQAALESGHFNIPDNWFGVRARSKVNFPLRLYHHRVHELDDVLKRASSFGIGPEELVYYDTGITQLADTILTLQGEICQCPDWHLRYTYRKEPMRTALMHEEHYASGLQALMLLKGHAKDSFYQDIRDILELYPGHVIEFACYETTFGELRGRNGFIWEVRNY